MFCYGLDFPHASHHPKHRMAVIRHVDRATAVEETNMTS